MKLVSIKDPICCFAQPLIPAIDPAGSNEQLFLMEYNGATLTEEVVFGNRGLSVTTAPIKPCCKFDLLANSNANALVMSGQIGVADTIRPDLKLSRLYVEILGDLFIVDVEDEDSARSHPDLIGDTRAARIDFWSDLTITLETLNAFGQRPLWHSMMCESVPSAFTIQLDLAGNVSLNRGVVRFTQGSASGPATRQEDAPEPTQFHKLVYQNSKIVGFTLKAHIGR